MPSDPMEASEAVQAAPHSPPHRWGLECPTGAVSHECALPESHDGNHRCTCGAEIACVCICHESGPTPHGRPCCPAWEGEMVGEIGEALPLIEARIRREVAAHIRAIPDDDGPFHTGVRKFIDRHTRLREGTSIVAVMLAVADEIEGDEQ
uniref:hypothetical protein n=1 Tax=Streptosporangium sp. CA-235898 TaxID=3240073 RepID=UPI003F49A60C